ncbi:MAG: ATP synthase F1 subunit delta [Planctomycetota bacterium]
MSLLAKRYATALHLAAKAGNAVTQVEQDLQSMHAGLQDRRVQALLQSPDVTSAERLRVVQKLGTGHHALVQNLLHVVLKRRRQEVLPDLYPAFLALCMQERGEIEGVVETPRPLGPDDLARLQEMARNLSGKTCVLTVRIRPELIGGVRLVLGNVLYDGSVQSSLQQLEQKLMQASV